MSRPLASFHVFSVERHRVPGALWRMAADPLSLRGTAGLRFARSVGTNRGDSFSLRDADLCRWGLFTVWDDREALERFERAGRAFAAWRRTARERWRVDLLPLRSRGAWGGRDPLAGAVAATDAPGPAAAVTRARIRWSQAVRFWRAVPPVAADLRRQPGLRLSFGFGEAPVGLQGTFSVWDSTRALTDYAYRTAAHQQVIRATQDLQWYGEELFARFAVVGSQGTIDGRDPVGGGHGIAGDA
ncbi:MAG TPA: hypothetical protein VM287_09730 [Egibacteraceae bacterium]|nr:hypothetical protein [Egibacteraceae bacterium]HVM14597.1 hypothetical protein [Egibacteraceae bacterium]HVM21412.1 hypothetical protein [Egibacteraceae bacterium]